MYACIMCIYTYMVCDGNVCGCQYWCVCPCVYVGVNVCVCVCVCVCSDVDPFVSVLS